MDVLSVVNFKQNNGLQVINDRLVDGENRAILIDNEGKLYSVVPLKDPVNPPKNCLERFGQNILKVVKAIINFITCNSFFKTPDSPATTQEKRLFKLADHFYDDLHQYKDVEKLTEEKKLELQKKREAYEPIRQVALSVWKNLKVPREKTPSMIQYDFSLKQKINSLLA